MAGPTYHGELTLGAPTEAGVHAVWCRSFFDGEHLNKRYNQSTWSAMIT